MCLKFIRKICSMVVFGAIAGGVYYYLKSKSENGRENGCILAEEMKSKKEQLKEAADDIKEDLSDIKDTAKSVLTPDDAGDLCKNGDYI